MDSYDVFSGEVEPQAILNDLDGIPAVVQAMQMQNRFTCGKDVTRITLSAIYS